MKFNKKHLLVLSVVSGISGCANLTESPYYRIWHDRAYELSASPAVMQQAMENSSIPEAEPASIEYSEPAPQTIAYTEAGYGNPINNNAYVVEEDPFKPYTRSEQVSPRLERQEAAPMRRDYSNMR